ncbi:protein SCO1/2 [Pseudoalteromonas citrea]|uniref:Protein SCO1/2 n=2 Tax=Pseudoalteromonas citrea TaxID=43655 RepID=A0AAD4FRC1_9GAMM|nr:SCO family protein [Pseudoalteromonas citrea]KAF7769053.1 protein SCO1/2 [Pseudoalteromonas citrea]
MRYFLLIFIMCLMLGCSEKPQTSDLVVHYTNPQIVKPFALNDENGEIITEKSLHDQWTLLFLGYTSCPDICPMTLAKLSQVYQQLEKDYPVSVWFVSVDPQRDTPAKRQAYINYFDDEFRALSGPHAQLFPFVRDIGLIYAINNSTEQEYYVDHSASVALINPQGELAAIFKAKYTVNEIPLIDVHTLVRDFKIIAI